MAVTEYFTVDNHGRLREISEHFLSCVYVQKHDMDDEHRMAGFYWACEQPERPHTGATCYMDNCHGCMLAATAAICDDKGLNVGVSYEDSEARRLFKKPTHTTTFGDWWIDTLRKQGSEGNG